jgi:hypothetical protein
MIRNFNGNIRIIKNNIAQEFSIRLKIYILLLYFLYSFHKLITLLFFYTST